jgi:hypothetical protein
MLILKNEKRKSTTDFHFSRGGKTNGPLIYAFCSLFKPRRMITRGGWNSILGESGRMSRPIRLRHFPHARMKLLASKIYIGLINIDFFSYCYAHFLEISRDTTFYNSQSTH